MAHFKRGNLQLKTNQQIQLGDSQESLINYDGSQLKLSNDGGELALDSTGGVTAVSYNGDGSLLTGLLHTVVEDASPQLGGDLYSNGFDIEIESLTPSLFINKTNPQAESHNCLQGC